MSIVRPLCSNRTSRMAFGSSSWMPIPASTGTSQWKNSTFSARTCIRRPRPFIVRLISVTTPSFALSTFPDASSSEDAARSVIRFVTSKSW